MLWDFNTEFETETDDADVLAERFARILELPEIVAVLAEDDGEAVGFALVSLRPAIWFDGPVSQLEELYVVPTLRSGGIGTQVLALCRRLVRDLGSPEMHINVDEVDVDTRRFYERHGFVNIEDGRRLPDALLHRPDHDPERWLRSIRKAENAAHAPLPTERWLTDIRKTRILLTPPLVDRRSGGSARSAPARGAHAPLARGPATSRHPPPGTPAARPGRRPRWRRR